ncbi:hypothetical protein VII00023_19559 [Vibrio ichthyoenteri ATCC 700023]|uniref:Uncharacterized protein n=1 Tax=Vibrio ichthyoenteri ATCC 700023 TaxID=870968 RepID=F9S3E2_9VIBR|nr:hypothetical protein [Vibrio ichthyoenteri]EGU38166.1 hypothetical protein VII00023_19559 [Vibrio ichthyoenteri ATCC 700023]
MQFETNEHTRQVQVKNHVENDDQRNWLVDLPKQVKASEPLDINRDVFLWM